MASPFAVFRRNQRILIAVSGIMAMIAFVFLDPVFRMLGGGDRTPENPVMVKTNYGNYKRSELDAIEAQRKWVGFFLQHVVNARVQKELEGKQIPPNSQYVQQYERYQYQAIQQQLMGRMSPPGDAAALETVILAKRAEEMGMVASDLAVNDFLRSISGDAFSQLRDIIARLKPDGKIPISQSYLFDALRREMLAARYAAMFQLGTMGMPPAERWEYFEQLNLNADAQVLPVKAEQFLKGIEQPSDEKLQAFFELYQNQLPVPNSPDPGFKEPTKIAFQYFVANLDKFIEVAADKVTDEEMHEYYEKNKDIEFRQLSLPPGKEKESPAKEGEMEDPLGPDEAQPDKPATGDSSPETKKEDDGDSPKNDEPAGDKASGDKPTGPKSSRVEPNRGTSPFRLTSAPQPATPETKPAAATDDKTPDAAPSDDKSATDKPATDAPATEPASDDSTPGEKAGSDDATKTPATEGAESGEKKYEPFEKVTGTIRTQIARGKAQKTIQDAFDRLYSQMRKYASARSAYLANKDDPDAKGPDPLDFSALADEYGVVARETQLISAYEAQMETDIGKSSNRQISFLELAYLEPHVYQPLVTADGENNSYLWWETKATPETIPALDDVRGKVLHAYKLKEARKLALAQADKYAKEVAAAKKPLSEVFKEREGLEVTDTGPFTRMTTGNMAFDPDSSEPRLSTVHGVDAAGEEFMNTVFGMSPGEVKVAWNQPQDIVYVIQLEKFSPERETLERDFMSEPFRKYAQVASNDQSKLYYNWIKTIEKDAGVDWVEQPRAATSRADDE